MRLKSRALKDLHYRPYALSGASEEELLAAGFFDDGLTEPIEQHSSWNISVPTTPVNKAFKRLKQAQKESKPAVVLLTTGSFSPVHKGHLAMMEAARSELEKQGFFVVAGYLSASHDNYVNQKAGGAAKLHHEHRLALLEEAVADSDWLNVCSWESRYAPVSLNFTDVLRRLKAYLAHHLRQPVEIAYVFGEDNWKFLNAFQEEDLAVCVRRGGIAQELTQKNSFFIVNRWFLADLKATHSSTEVRKGNLELLPEKIKARYERLRSGPKEESQKAAYLVRDDLFYGASVFPVKRAAIEEFSAALIRLFKEHFETDETVQVRSLDLSAQRDIFSSILKRDPTATIVSLDACVEHFSRLDISREFELGGGQVYSRTVVARPGYPGVPYQLQTLLQKPVKEVVVVDDDTASGFTKSMVTTLLTTSGLAPSRFEFLNERLLKEEKSPLPMKDIVDARDFLLGARDGGLVVKLADSESIRVPYALPFVNLVFRAKLEPSKCKAMSIAIWQLNAKWFATHLPFWTVSQLPPSSRRVWEIMGFQADLPLHALAERMAKYLENTP